MNSRSERVVSESVPTDNWCVIVGLFAIALDGIAYERRADWQRCSSCTKWSLTMPESMQLAAETDDATDAPFSFSTPANRAVLAVGLAIPAILLALLLTNAERTVAIGGILLVVAWLVTVFRFEVRPRERTVTIRWLWLGLLEWRAPTYSFSDVRGLRYSPFGWGEDGYRWEFQDGATYYLMVPIDARLLRWFRGESNKTWEAHETRFQKRALLAGFLLCTTLTLFTDVVAGRDIMRQLRSRSYLPVAGHILRSSVKPCDDDSSLWNYEPDIQYSFVVNGIAYTETSYRYSPPRMCRFSESTARALLPKGETTTVYYNSLDPADAVLSPGLGGLDVFTLLCLLPLNAVVLIGAIACFSLARYRALPGVSVWYDGCVVRAGIHRWSPTIAAVAAAGAVAFVLIFAVGLPTGGNPSVAVASFGWLIVLCVAGLAWRASVRALAKGTRDLVIDREQRTLTLPVEIWWRKEPLTIPWESLSGIEIEDTQDKSVAVHYAVVALVSHADGTTTRERLTYTQDYSSANALAAWVRGMLYPFQPGG